MISPLPLDSAKAKQGNYRHSVQNSQILTPKSVSFSVDRKRPLSKGIANSCKHSKSRELAIALTDGLFTFDKKNRCKVLFQVVDDKGKAKLEVANRQNSPTEFVPLMTDSFQYRTEGILEEEDLMLDMTHDKNLLKKAIDIDHILGLWRGIKQKKNNVALVKTQPRMRRKSDTSSWSGGASELERKTFFWTYEYVAKTINVQIDTKNLGKDMESAKNSKPSWKMDVSPSSLSRKSTQAKLKQLSRMALEMTKDVKCDKSSEKESPYLPNYASSLRDPLLLGDNLGHEPESSNLESKLNELSEEDKSKENYIGSITHLKLPESHSHSKVPSFAKPIEIEQAHKKPGQDPNESIKIDSNYKPFRPARINFPQTVKAGSAAIKHSRVFDKSSVSSSTLKIRRKERSTASLIMKKQPDAKNDSMSGNSVEDNQKRDDSKDSKKSRRKSPEPSSSNKIKVMLKLHETLVKKIYSNQTHTKKFFSHENSTISIKGLNLDEKSRSPPRTPRKEKKKSTWKENSVIHHSQQLQLPRLDPRRSPMMHSSAKNSVEKSQNKSIETTKKGKVDKILSPGNSVMGPFKLGKSEKISVMNFKPKISGPNQLMLRYAPFSTKNKFQES